MADQEEDRRWLKLDLRKLMVEDCMVDQEGDRNIM